MKKLRKYLAKYTVLKSLECQLLLPSHFDKKCFALAAMYNFDNADKSSLSGIMQL